MGNARRRYKWDFFIAHAGADKQMAEDLYDLLAPKSRVFLDSVCLRLGDSWDIRLPIEQKASFVTVVLVSSRTDLAYYQREEIAAAIALARGDEYHYRVVPIYLDDAARSSDDVPYGLRLKHGLQLSKTCILAQAASELLKLLKRRNAHFFSRAKVQSGTIHEGFGIIHQPTRDWLSPVQNNCSRYKLVAFDFDGTLLRGSSFDFSWEIVWEKLGFGKAIQNKLKREYRQQSESSSRAKRIKAYQTWCNKACAHFRQRGITREQLRNMCDSLRLTQNCREALTELRSCNLVTMIISGGINTFLEDTFPDFHDYFDFVFMNQLKFSSSGLLEGVCATPYDFQGKAEALELVQKRIGCSSSETVFVGDHFNDEAVMLKVDKGIAYPPQDSVIEGVSHISISEDNLMAILPHVLVE